MGGVVGLAVLLAIMTVGAAVMVAVEWVQLNAALRHRSITRSIDDLPVVRARRIDALVDDGERQIRRREREATFLDWATSDILGPLDSIDDTTLIRAARRAAS